MTLNCLLQSLSVRQVLGLLSNLVRLDLLQVWTGQRGQALSAQDIQLYVDPSTIVVTRHTSFEISAAFRLNTVDDMDKWRTTSIAAIASTLPQLVVSERIRRAVLQPLDPLVYRVAATLSLSGRSAPSPVYHRLSSSISAVASPVVGDTFSGLQSTPVSNSVNDENENDTGGR
jgi:hypothetical protein